jgi:hypothetical protein
VAVAFDAVGPATTPPAHNSGVATLSWTHTTGAITNGALLVACDVMDTAGGDSSMTVTCTYNGVSMTQLLRETTTSGAGNGFLVVFGLAGNNIVPSAGKTVTITTATLLPNDLAAGSLSFSGVDQNTPFGTPVAANSDSTYSVVIPSTTAGNYCAGFVATGSAIGSISAGTQEYTYNVDTSGATGSGAAGVLASPGGSATISWASGGASVARGGVEVLAGAAGASPAVGMWPSRPGKSRLMHHHGARRQQPFPTLPLNPDANVTAGVAAAFGNASNPATAPPTITGLAGVPGAGYFTDQNGKPRLWVASETWGIVLRAGQWTTPAGNWQSDFDNFFSARAAQGVTVTLLDPVGPGSADTSDNPPGSNGVTWDGIAPFSSTSPVTLNGTFWARIDYLLNSAASNGITVGLAFNLEYDFTTGGVFNGWSTTQFQQYGAAIGARYASQQNIIWLFGNDSFPTGTDTQFSSILTGLTSAGANQLTVAWWEAEYTSRYETDNNLVSTFGAANSDINFCYSYNAGYWIIEYAYSETASPDNQANLLPTVLGDGYFYQGGTSYSSTLDRAMRQDWWWELASGARGILTESENVFPWTNASALVSVSTNWSWVNNLPNIVSYFTGLAGWHLLLPDLSSALVTAGRGTRVSGFTAGGSGGQYEPAFTNSYVAASLTPDGTLAVLYLPNATTITVNTALLASGWTATWVDPVTTATSSAGAGPTFNSTAKGNNSQGNPDWVLVFQSPPVATQAAAQWPSRPSKSRLMHHHGARRQQPYPTLPSSSADASATDQTGALATGAAFNPVVTVTASDQTGALATGAAQQPAALVTALPATASATGAAQQPVAQVTALPTAALATGVAQQPVAQVTALLSAAAGTGTAYNPSVSTSGNATAAAGLASATGAAQQPVALVTAADQTGALATAAAFAPANGRVPGTATATGAALAPANGRVPATAAATGAAQQPVAQVTALPAAATAAGAALAPVAPVTALPATAAATGAALSPAAALIVFAGLASATGSAYNPSVTTGGDVNAAPGAATAAGAAQQATAAVTALPAAATATGTALAPANGRVPSTASAAGAASAPAAQVAASPAAASGTGAAQQPVSAIVVFPGFAAGTGAAFLAANGRVPGGASATAAALAPALSLAATAQAATALAAALQATGAGLATVVKGASTGTSVSEASGMAATTGEAARTSASVTSAAASAPSAGEGSGTSASVAGAARSAGSVS